MNAIQQLIEQRDWAVTIEVDPNVGGDGTRVRFDGDARSFRKLELLFNAMAETVEDPEHPASQVGWHLAFNPADLPQLEIKNAAIWTLNCLPNEQD